MSARCFLKCIPFRAAVSAPATKYFRIIDTIAVNNYISLPKYASLSPLFSKKPLIDSLLWSRRSPVGPTTTNQRKSPEPSSGNSNNNSKPPPNADLMDFPWIIWPSLMLTMKNWFFATFIIKPYYDPDFSLSAFREGAKQALVSVSEDLADGNIKNLSDRVTPDAVKELTQKFATLSLKQKTDLRVIISDIFFSFPYQLGVIFDGQGEGEEERIYVEITMCYHVFRDFENYLEERGSDQTSSKEHIYSHNDRFTIANYRFIREVTKGVDDDWTINVINHFKPGERVRH